MENKELRSRQIHLDFHTSEKIENVGAKFNAKEFASTLYEADVNSVTCFARCHHGMIYYDSKENPERIHPHLANKNLLKEQIEACHERGIKVPIYTTVQWDYYTAQKHPEWLVKNEDFSDFPETQDFYEGAFYQFLCINSPYKDFLKNHVTELLEDLPVDGLFFDIIFPVDCSCNYCMEEMKEKGINFYDKESRLDFAKQVVDRFKLDMTEHIRSMNSKCTIFYNRGHVGPNHRLSKDAYTHFEIESLPGGAWGYLHFPITARYARNLGKDTVGMTGKFHTTWGDFHSFKNKETLEFECNRMLAFGAKSMVGDQLEPSGELSKHVYDLIGSVYSDLKKKEPWCEKAIPLSDIGVLTPEEFEVYTNQFEVPVALKGVTRMLQESGHQFEIIDTTSDFNRYKVIILPDHIEVNSSLHKKLREYLTEGGKVLSSFESGLDNEKEYFLFNEMGVKMRESQTTDNEGNLVRGKYFERNDYADYILPKDEIGKGIPNTEHVMYMKGVELEQSVEGDILAHTIKSHFDRSYNHFCSHRQTPSSGEIDYPAIVRNNNIIYFSHPIFTIYNQSAPRWTKKLFLNALNLLLPTPLIKHNGPSSILVTVNEQVINNRRIVHLLHYIPEKRSEQMEIIEDVIPLYNIDLEVASSKPVKRIRCVPENRELEFTENDSVIKLTVPNIEGHQMISIEYK